MKTREEFKKLVIEKIHGLPYEEALEKEFITNGGSVKLEQCHIKGGIKSWCKKCQAQHKEPYLDDVCESKIKVYNHRKLIKNALSPDLLDFVSSITIGRVMQALNNINPNHKGSYFFWVDGAFGSLNLGRTTSEKCWKLTKENGQECTDSDQTIECIEAITNLLKT